MKNLTWQNPEQLFVAQELINKVKSKCCGIKVFNIEHPVFTAGVGQDWIYTDDGKPQYWAIDNYFITGERNTHFLGCDVVKQHHTLTQIIMGLLNNGFELKVVEEADFLEEFDPRYNEEGVSELDEQFERLPDGHEAKRSYYLGFRQAQSEARPNIVISLLKLVSTQFRASPFERALFSALNRVLLIN